MAELDESYEVRLSQQLKSAWLEQIPQRAGSELIRLLMAKVVSLLQRDRKKLLSLLYGDFDLTPRQGTARRLRNRQGTKNTA